MCVVSMIMDDYWKRNKDDSQRHIQPTIYPYSPSPSSLPIPTISREEFDELKRDIKELKKLILAAKKYDEATGQPDCEQAEKMALLRKLAELVGVDLSDLTSLAPI
jgi:hypothetical protein